MPPPYQYDFSQPGGRQNPFPGTELLPQAWRFLGEPTPSPETFNQFGPMGPGANGGGVLMPQHQVQGQPGGQAPGASFGGFPGVGSPAIGQLLSLLLGQPNGPQAPQPPLVGIPPGQPPLADIPLPAGDAHMYPDPAWAAGMLGQQPPVGQPPLAGIPPGQPPLVGIPPGQPPLVPPPSAQQPIQGGGVPTSDFQPGPAPQVQQFDTPSVIDVPQAQLRPSGGLTRTGMDFSPRLPGQEHEFGGSSITATPDPDFNYMTALANTTGQRYSPGNLQETLQEISSAASPYAASPLQGAGPARNDPMMGLQAPPAGGSGTASGGPMGGADTAGPYGPVGPDPVGPSYAQDGETGPTAPGAEQGDPGYLVQEGDTLYDIADSQGIERDRALASMRSQGRDPNKISTGERLDFFRDEPGPAKARATNMATRRGRLARRRNSQGMDDAWWTGRTSPGVGLGRLDAQGVEESGPMDAAVGRAQNETPEQDTAPRKRKRRKRIGPYAMAEEPVDKGPDFDAFLDKY